MTDGQSPSLSWCQATIRARDRFFFLLDISYRKFWVCYFVAPSLTRGRACNLLLLLGLASAVPLAYESRETQHHILLSQFLRFLQPGGPDLRIYIPQGQGGSVIPLRPLGSLSVASYETQSYGGGILCATRARTHARTHAHTYLYT
jgi:hypothetical protein